jgi:GPH family glycoside/pentoside/hexuronide:cation symporter
MWKKRMAKNLSEKYAHSKSTTLAFGFGAMTDQMSHQAFQFLVFTFYYAVVGVNIKVIAAAFIIFAIWDSINDPIIGALSDKTRSKFGRRRFWVLVSLLPFAAINFLLFTPPQYSETGKAVYMVIIIMLYDLFYSMFSTNQTSLFPEMFPTERQRGRANLLKNLMMIVGLLIGFVLPTLFISPLAPTENTPSDVVAKIPSMYRTTGLILAILVLVCGILFFQFGMKEPEQPPQDKKTALSMLESLKITLKNKTFIIFVVANLFVWFTFKMLTTIITLYGIHVLGIGEGDFFLTILLLAAFLSATAFFPVMEKMGEKFGMRNAFMISSSVWFLAFIPFAFLDNQPIIAVICMIFMGFGLSGAMYYVDIIIGGVIDEDELKMGHRRAGSYYGINALINRYSTILVFVAIAVVLSGYGWENYLIGSGLNYEGLRMGLKILFVGTNMVSLVIVLILLYIFPLHGQQLKEIQEKLHKQRQ